MLIPLVGSVLGAAWTSGETQFEVAPFPGALSLPGKANRLRRKAVWSDRRWLICIPIASAGGGYRFVIQIDGNSILPNVPQVADAVSQIEEAVSEFFNLIIKELAGLEDGHGLEE
jgi:NTE family protein